MSRSFRKFVQFKFPGCERGAPVDNCWGSNQVFNFPFGFEPVSRRCIDAANGDKFDQFVRSPARNRQKFQRLTRRKICLLLSRCFQKGTISFFPLQFPPPPLSSSLPTLVLVQRDREIFRGWHQVFLVEWRRFPCKLRIYKLESSWSFSVG